MTQQQNQLNDFEQKWYTKTQLSIFWHKTFIVFTIIMIITCVIVSISLYDKIANETLAIIIACLPGAPAILLILLTITINSWRENLKTKYKLGPYHDQFTLLSEGQIVTFQNKKPELGLYITFCNGKSFISRLMPLKTENDSITDKDIQKFICQELLACHGDLSKMKD